MVTVSDVFSNGPSTTGLIRGLAGILFLLVLSFLLSSNKKNISYKLVFSGLLLQVLIAVGIIYVGFFSKIFRIISQAFVVLFDFVKEGSEFLFGGLMNTESYGFIFAFQVLPIIIFFSAFTSFLFYLGIIQKIVYGLAWLLTKTLKISGAEGLAVAGNIFLGQNEAPLLIKGYLDKMDRSSIFLIMTSGMATLAGSVLAAYTAFLGGTDPVERVAFAGHLLTASVMAAPGAIVIAKILFPQAGPVEKYVEIPGKSEGRNILEAISNGTSQGIKIAVNVGAMLIVFVTFITMFNFILLKAGNLFSINETIAEAYNGQYPGLSLQFILGNIFAPVMWLIGIPAEDILLTGRLLGEKIILTEFISYISLADIKNSGILQNPKSIIMATYFLSGFANFASVGIQIGGIGALVPPKKIWLTEMGIRAMIGGTIASLLSATIIGLFIS